MSTTPQEVTYGGGGGDYTGVSGGDGAVRIVWPGASRTFPSTKVGREDSDVVYVNGVEQ